MKAKLTALILTLFFILTVQAFCADTDSGTITLISPDSENLNPVVFSWDHVEGATSYRLSLVNASTGERVEDVIEWYEIEDNTVLPDVECADGTCTVAANVTLAPGQYQWWVKGYNQTNEDWPDGKGPWSDGMSFSVREVDGFPSQATPVSPEGVIQSRTPEFIWNEDIIATWYQISVKNTATGTSTLIKQWYEIEDNESEFSQATCSGGKCSAVLSTALEPGDYTWQVKGYNEEYGPGDWSEEKSFTIDIPLNLPGQVTLISPDNQAVNNPVAYSWQPASNAETYFLTVKNGQNEVQISKEFTAADSGCENGSSTCAVTLEDESDVPDPGTYTWTVRAGNQDGNGETSTAKTFTIEDSPVCTDNDEDGYYAQAGCGTDQDLNDADAGINPGVQEICGDEIDNDCDGETDEGCLSYTNYTNDFDMSFNQVQPGTFEMGSPRSESGRYDNETLHQVTLTQPFFMQTTEVTQGQWKAVMTENPSEFSECGDNCPVDNVTYEQIIEFINILNQQEQTGHYRLPTEAEWEYAARAGTDTAFAGGDLEDQECNDTGLAGMAWYKGNSGPLTGVDACEIGSAHYTHEVKQKQPNALGLYDMHGNVFEMCADWYGDYSADPQTDPKGPLTGEVRVIRGGSYDKTARKCRSAYRVGYQASLKPGFRLVYSDQGPALTTFYRDSDNDGYGDPEFSQDAVSQPTGYVTDFTDCDDTRATVNPGASEICSDQIDNDCDQEIDEEDCIVCIDSDDDGFYADARCQAQGTPTDCNDNRQDVYPGAVEICGDGLDNNCDGEIDETDGCMACTDADNDGYYAEEGCPGEPDCDDNDQDVNPGEEEICFDGKDNNCDESDDGVGCPVAARTHELGMTFNLIEKGSFTMGSPEGELGRDEDEVEHTVTITKDFYIQTTEVTQAQWEAVMGTTPSFFDQCGGDCPVENVSWNDVQKFISRLNSLDSTEGFFRLPTEAEWEYAARAGTTTAFHSGEIKDTECDDTNLNKAGWYCNNRRVSYEGCVDLSTVGGPSCAGIHAVAQKQANAQGLYDMHGNVDEWCADFYGEYDLEDTYDPAGASSGSFRVTRGGAWPSKAETCRSAERWFNPEDYTGNKTGFRLVWEKNIYYPDTDNDGYGDPDGQALQGWSLPSGYSGNNYDCNDRDGTIYLGAPEICGDGIDQDCSGSDRIASNEICYDGIDNNCNGEIDENCGEPDYKDDKFGLAFKEVEAGSFTMGSPGTEEGRDEDEIPHLVTLTQSFFIQTTEVTQGQWRAVMGENPSYFNKCGANCPVENISYNDACEFIDRLNELTDKGTFRLPTEAEWEYAARAGTDTAFANGDITDTECNDPKLNVLGWYCSDQAVSYPGCVDLSAVDGPKCAGIHEVAGKLPNSWGLYDMHGNVQEWCFDKYGDYQTDDRSDPQGASSGMFQVVRGGAWPSKAESCRSAERWFNPPLSTENKTGFRLVFTMNEEDMTTFYRDADQDGYGDTDDFQTAFLAPEGYVTDNSDCDDNDTYIHPGAEEICGDGIDNNCDAQIDETNCISCTDADNDGYSPEPGCSSEPDCDDDDETVYPGAQEICNDGIDNNCSGETDEADCITCTDDDDDGYYDEDNCPGPRDCDDADRDIHPGAVEICGNGIDENCDGIVQEMSEEICHDGIDNDCDGVVDEACTEGPDDIQNSLGMVFKKITSGTFTMGSSVAELYRDDGETAHEVTLSRDFYLQATEVTQGQWAAVMGENPSHFNECGNDCPVEKVSYEDAMAFIGRLNRQSTNGTVYRLPTEAEWEYAARAGTGTAFSAGDITNSECNDPVLNDIGWYCGNREVDYDGCVDLSGVGGPDCAGLHGAALKEPNAWGLYDMHGNVEEWCADWYDRDYYSQSPDQDPEGPAIGSNRVIRGGHWNAKAPYCRSASRTSLSPVSKKNQTGFRLVCEPGTAQ